MPVSCPRSLLLCPASYVYSTRTRTVQMYSYPHYVYTLQRAANGRRLAPSRACASETCATARLRVRPPAPRYTHSSHVRAAPPFRCADLGGVCRQGYFDRIPSRVWHRSTAGIRTSCVATRFNALKLCEEIGPKNRWLKRATKSATKYR